MNIENLLSVIKQISTGTNGSAELSGKLNLTDFLEANLNLTVGQKLQININDDFLHLTDSMGKTLQLPAQNLHLEKTIPFNEPIQMNAKIIQSQNGTIALEITNINDKPVSQYLRSEVAANATESQAMVIVKDLGGIKNLPLQNINLDKIATPLLKEVPLTPEQQNTLQNALQKVEIQVQLNDISQKVSPNNEVKNLPIEQIQQKIADTLKEIPIKLASVPQIQVATVIQDSVADLVNNLQQVKGQIFPATITKEGFSSELGFIRPEIPVTLPEEMSAELKILDVIQTASPKRAAHTVNNLLESIKKIQSEDPQLYTKIISKLPTNNENMLKNMTTFIKAAAKNNIRQWLGDEIITEIENKGETGRAVLNEMQTSLQSTHRQSPLWRIIEIPYYIENHLEQIKLAVKQYPDDEDNEPNPKDKFGTRFIVDTNFTKLGAFQFDGFSFSKERRFDLIIRTAYNIDDDLYSNIIRIFKQTLNDVQYIGNIKINLKENFIKISENKTEDNILAQGLFI